MILNFFIAKSFFHNPHFLFVFHHYVYAHVTYDTLFNLSVASLSSPVKNWIPHRGWDELTHAGNITSLACGWHYGEC